MTLEIFLDNALRDRLICGMRYISIQKSLLCSDSDLTFADALKNANAMLLAESQSKAIHGDMSSVVEVLHSRSSSHSKPGDSYNTERPVTFASTT